MKEVPSGKARGVAETTPGAIGHKIRKSNRDMKCVEGMGRKLSTGLLIGMSDGKGMGSRLLREEGFSRERSCIL